MPRKTLKPEERRRTIAFSLSGLDIKALDNYIKKESEKAPYSIISRQTILEGLVLEFLASKKAAQ